MPNKINARYIEGLPVIGFGQTWQNVTGSRSSGITYTNDTGRPIQLSIMYSGSGNTDSFTFSINGVVVFSASNVAGASTVSCNHIIPSGSTYLVTISGSTGGTLTWFELR